MKRLKLERFYDPVALLSAAPVSLVVVMGAVLSYRSHAILRENRDLVVHTHEVIEVTQKVLISAGDAETGQRGFVITKEAAFLEPYFQAVRTNVPHELQVLAWMVRDNPRQQQRAYHLKQLLDEKFQELARTIQMSRQSNFEAVRQTVANQSGKTIMDEVRDTIAKISQTERDLLAARTRDVEESEHRIVVVGFVTAAVSTLARLAVAFWRQRLVSGKQQPV